MNPILVGKNVCKYYKMGEVTVKALNNASFEIYDGEFIVILGPSGSGKSTLLNMIGGMDSVTKGELYYKDQPLHLVNSKKLTQYRRNTVGFVFQFYNLMPNLNAYENVKLAVEISKNPLSVKKVLKEVGLENRSTHFPSQLSGGQQQRVALARAIAKNPKILLCDEPTGALDIQTGIGVLKILKNYSSNYNKTVIIITHNSGIANIADRVFNIVDGTITNIKTNSNPIPPEEVSW